MVKSPSLTRTTRLSAMSEKEKQALQDAPTAAGFTEERGVSVDQDGKSNVWAIEPKVEISGKSNEEMTKAGYIAVGGLGGFAVLAFLILSNLPDPNNY
jgi:hypothetical protein